MGNKETILFAIWDPCSNGGVQIRCPHFRSGLAFTGFLAVFALQLSLLPGLEKLGMLTLALLAGIVARAALHVPENQHAGIGFSAKTLLRIGIVLLGARLDFRLLGAAGPRILFLAASVITAGLWGISRIGKAFGLPRETAALLAVDSSICGASAVAAAAPAIRARSEDIALVVPLCSLIGTAGVLGLTFAQSALNIAPGTFGVLAGSTLHEIAQVMAAASAIPSALESGTVTKLARVVLLAPAVLILWWISARNEGGGKMPGLRELARLLESMWFVFGFLLVAAIFAVARNAFPETAVAGAGRAATTVAAFLMAMAMAGLGLQVDFGRLRRNGARVAAAAILGWLGLLALASVEIYFLRL